MLDNNNYNYNNTDYKTFRVANNRFLSTYNNINNPYRILYLSNSISFRDEIAAHHLRTGGIYHAGHDQAASVAERNRVHHQWWQQQQHHGQVRGDGHTCYGRRRPTRNGHDPTQTKV